MPGYITGTPISKWKTWKTSPALPYTLQAMHGARQIRDGSWHVNSHSAVEGTIIWTSALGGCTGALYACGSPTGYYDNRYKRLHEIGSTGVLDMAGATGIDGLYRTTWRINVPGITGVGHGQYYGFAAYAGETGTYGTAEIVIKVDDKIK